MGTTGNFADDMNAEMSNQDDGSIERTVFAAAFAEGSRHAMKVIDDDLVKAFRDFYDRHPEQRDESCQTKPKTD